MRTDVKGASRNYFENVLSIKNTEKHTEIYLFLGISITNCAKRPLRPCAQSKLDVLRPCVRPFGKNVTFVLADKRGGHMLESKHDLKLENRRILQGPEKRGPKFCISA